MSLECISILIHKGNLHSFLVAAYDSIVWMPRGFCIQTMLPRALCLHQPVWLPAKMRGIRGEEKWQGLLTTVEKQDQLLFSVTCLADSPMRFHHWRNQWPGQPPRTPADFTSIWPALVLILTDPVPFHFLLYALDPGSCTGHQPIPLWLHECETLA